MKLSIIFLLFFSPILAYGQVQNPLTKLMWDRVNNCFSMFEDSDEDGNPDFEKIDDSKNGYLKIFGTWPACGCSCSSTVGAYKNQKGEYIFLQSDNMSCSWEKKISSNKSLKDILPVDFGISSFIPGKITQSFINPIFFIDFEIPRVGTDTKVKIKLVPFGLKPNNGKELYCFEYTENEKSENWASIYNIRVLAQNFTDIKTFDYLLSGNFEKISKADKELINKTIGNDNNQFKTLESILLVITEFKKIYEIYSMIESIELTLSWNKQDSRFIIKDKGSKPEKISFKDFLINCAYYSPMC